MYETCIRDRTAISMLIPWQGKVGKGPRYAIYDFGYDLPGGEGSRYVFLSSRMYEAE